jgi:hypothetical protein
MTLVIHAILADSSSIGDFVARDFGILFAVCLMAIHFLAPYCQGFVERHEEQIGSLGRGLAVTYVFLHLFEEIESGRETIGHPIYLLMLIGFLVYYGLEHRIEMKIAHESVDPRHPAVRLQFATIMFFKWVYSWLIIYSIPSTIREDGMFLLPGLIAVCLHVLHDDVEMVSRFKQHYQHEGRVILALAPWAGWWAHRILHPQNSHLSHILTALLAGSVLYSTFSGELREHRKSVFGWFVIGILCYAGLHAMSVE